MGARGYIGVEMPTAAKSKHARPAGVVKKSGGVLPAWCAGAIAMLES